MNELGVLEPHDLSGYSRMVFPDLAPCPLCGANEAVETSGEELPIVGLGCVRIGYGYCGKCGHIHQVRPVPAEMLAEYYRKFSNYTVAKPEIARNLSPSPMTSRLLSIARDNITGCGTVYEVGCATGAHLNHFRWNSWTVKGCDPSPKACSQAKEIYGLDVECGLEDETIVQQRNLDLVLFSGVLEHLPEPVEALKRARAALKYDGMVLIEVPCATSPEVLPPGYFAFEHLHYYTFDAVKRLLNLAGFKLIEARVGYRDFIYPVITAIAQRVDEELAIPAGDTGAADRFIRDYRVRDKAIWARSIERISSLAEPMYIWGAGIHTSQLIDRFPDLPYRVAGFIDSDPQKHGEMFAGKLVISPETYFDTQPKGPLVISSFYKEKEIAARVRSAGVNVSVIRLYG